MGYFSNGTEGMFYEEQFCNHCVHQSGQDGESGCAVWLAHMMFNYKECNNDKTILDVLIPRTKDDLGNKQCSMFHASDPLRCKMTTDLFEDGQALKKARGE